jgi:hypothetical protein
MAVRLLILPSFKLNIHNQCLNFDLISPTYINSRRLECHKAPNYKVCAGDTMKSSFMVKSDKAFYGALVYEL